MSIQSVGKFGESVPRPTAPQGAATVGGVPKADPVKLQATPQQTAQPPDEKVLEAVQEISKKMEAVSPGSFEFSIDEDARMTVVRITDRKTGDLIRQVPAPELVELAKDLDRMQGLLLQQQA